MKRPTFLVAAFAGSAVLWTWDNRALAADLDGVWATQASECDKIFLKQGGLHPVWMTPA